jgi:class 3 adenylate cyclase
MFILFTVAPALFLLSTSTALSITAAHVLVFIASSLALGTHNSVLASATCALTVAGLAGARSCHESQIVSRQQFAIAKGTKAVVERSRDVLYSLIPQNVLTKLSLAEPGAFLGTPIAHCAVMFCSLDALSAARSSFSEPLFRLTHAVFRALDDAVQRFGMFKYQHVAEWYIVACPRAANPYDPALQAKPYPGRHHRNMVRLAHELVRIAADHTLPGGGGTGDIPLLLRAGIACGPAAGAVVGSLRAFYCLLGDTVNTAARMCSNAEPGRVLCSPELARCLSESAGENDSYSGGESGRGGGSCVGGGGVLIEPRGQILVKGKGLMETFYVDVTADGDWEGEEDDGELVDGDEVGATDGPRDAGEPKGRTGWRRLSGPWASWAGSGRSG